MASVVISHHRGVAQLASAPRLGRGGRRFKSSHPDHKYLCLSYKTYLRYQPIPAIIPLI